jgi:hypothetical protein
MSISPSPLYSGERGFRGEGLAYLSPHPLSPEYRGEGDHETGVRQFF